jgi:hypothetical protein
VRTLTAAALAWLAPTGKSTSNGKRGKTTKNGNGANLTNGAKRR